MSLTRKDFITPPAQPDPDRHSRKCVICRHPDRDDIDSDHLHWRSPADITRQYQLPHHSTIYRHAYATGLKAQRRENLASVLESIIEQAETVKPSASAVISAVRLYSQITGQWAPPERASGYPEEDPNRESEIRN